MSELMEELSGAQLELLGKEIFSKLGIRCVYPTAQTPLQLLDPTGPYSGGDHLEFDYLLPCVDTCLLGEITGRRNPSDVRSKHSRFRRHYDILRGLEFDERIWQLLGVPDERLRDFRLITEVRGLFITTELQKLDVQLSQAPGIACFYKADWMLLKEYAESIGTYARPYLLHRFDVIDPTSRRSLTLTRDTHGLICTPRKKIASGEVDLADIFTFEVSPYELLPIAQVYRRDELPSLSSTPESDYQRALIPAKLNSIRKKLMESRDFMFPGSIMVVLSDRCQYLADTGMLVIPEVYGALSVIDGQHRLLSYADDDVRAMLGDDGRIMVTAIRFPGADAATIRKFSAKAFVEINTNQTPVRPTHLDAIAYEVLGQTHARAIAAQVLLQVNRRSGPLQGLFDTNQTGLGIIQTSTVLGALRTITDLRQIESLNRTSRSGSRLAHRRGYENLFEATIDRLIEADVLIRRGVFCIERYFGLVKSTFHHDWPRRGGDPESSSFYRAKIIAAFVRLLRQFMVEGQDWTGVQTQLTKIRENVMRLCQVSTYDAPLFDPVQPLVPNARPSAHDDFHFLNENRGDEPVSIQAIQARNAGGRSRAARNA